MQVILLTVFVGLVLVGFALAFFVFTRKTARWSSAERDSLMPLEEEKTVLHRKPARDQSDPGI